MESHSLLEGLQRLDGLQRNMSLSTLEASMEGHSLPEGLQLV